MNKAWGWILVALIAIWLVVCADQARSDEGNTQANDLWTLIQPEIAPRRVQVLNMMVNRHLQRAGFDVPTLPVWKAMNNTIWDSALPQGAVAYADRRGPVVNEDWVDITNSSWPPMIDSVRILFHESLHQIAAVPGGAYGQWTPQQRAIEEGRVEAAAILLTNTFYSRHWPRAIAIPSFDSYPSCVRVIQVTAARATNTKLSTRTARSFTLWLMRTDIDTATALAYEHGLHDDLVACEQETGTHDHTEENNNA